MRVRSRAALVACAVVLLLVASGCGGGGSSCGGTTFVNQSGETVTVSANALSGIQFSTFTLSSGDENKICGDDTNDIMGDYAWPGGDTYSKGLTWSGGNYCIDLLSNHTADSEESS